MTETAPTHAHDDAPVHDGHEVRDTAHDQAHGGHAMSDRQYVQIALILAVITAMEVYASYADWLGKAFIPLLLFMMAIKFVSVVLYFMHLKFDSRIFSWLFYAGLLLAVGVYTAALLTFKFFNP
jgi:cytochrome c oxidase subunit 4